MFWTVLSLLYGLVYITPELLGSPFSTIRAFVMIILKWTFLTFCASGLICLLSVNRIVFAVMFPLLCLVSGAVAYFQLSIGVGLSPGVIDLAMANGVSVWMTLFSWQLLMSLFMSLMFGCVAAVIRWKCVRMDISSIDALMLSVAIIFIPTNVSPKLRESIMTRMPYTIYHSVDIFHGMSRELAIARTTYDAVDVMRSDASPDVVFVIGESLRADHLPFNGYERNTMPLLSRDSTLVSYPNIYSESFYTHACVPAIMTDTDSLTRRKAYTEQSFITLFKKAGYDTAWFANQDLTDWYAFFAHEADTIYYCNNVMSVYNFSSYYDADILPLFDQWSQRRDNDAPQLAVLHTIGSHWWYKSHYPDTVGNFLPEISSHDVRSSSHQQLVNSYDNTILETDRFLAALISRLKDRNAIMIYISDHGENLGEHGEYLHVNGYEETRRPACLIWYSDKYGSNFPDKAEAIRQNRFEEGLTDRLFHTAVDAAGLVTDAYSPSRSLFHTERSISSGPD